MESQNFFTTFDGVTLFYRYWKSSIQTKKVIVLMHRGHEHSGRLSEIADRFVKEGYTCFAYDSRGHGRSPGLRGHCEDFSYLVKDLDEFVKYISLQYSIDVEDITLLANSVSAVVVSAWVHDYAPHIRGMVLAAPAFSIKLYVPFALTGLRLMQLFKKPIFVKSYVKSNLLTHDVKEQKKYDEDSLITKEVSASVLLSLFYTAKRVVSDAGAIEIPTLILSAGSDWVVHLGPQKVFFNNLSSKNKEMIVYPDFYHGVLYEKEKNKPLDKAHNFIANLYTHKPDRSQLLKRDTVGFTKDEYDMLRNHPALIKKIIFGFTRLSMSTLGTLSKGIKTGVRYGYDSGLSLDHVYKNKAEGVSVLGKLMDRSFLDAIGWRGIRVRKQNLQKLIDIAVFEILAKNEPVRILDIAAGPGRYLIEKAVALKGKDIKILLCDNVEANLHEGEKIAKHFDCNNVAFKVNDSFDMNSYSSLGMKPNIVIISGLFELFNDNSKVLEALKGIVSIAENDCIVIYSGQPWHPQLEFIAYTLKNRLGEPWIMRRRTQAELDYIFEYAGFKKENMEIDSWGIFTVSLAKLKKNN